MRNPVVCFLEVDKACEDIFSILPRFLKILLESEMWSVLLRPGRKPTKTASFRFDPIISWRLFSRHLETQMLIIWKFPKSIAGRTKRPRRPRVWDPWYRTFLTPTSISKNYLGSGSISGLRLHSPGCRSSLIDDFQLLYNKINNWKSDLT